MTRRFFVTAPMLATVEVTVDDKYMTPFRSTDEERRDITLAAQRALGVPNDTMAATPISRVVTKAIGQHGDPVIVEVPA